MKPFEVVGIALACGAFVLLIVLLTIKDIVFALVFGGVAMVVVLIVLALLLLGYSPNPEVPTYLDREIPGYTNPGAHGATTAVPVPPSRVPPNRLPPSRVPAPLSPIPATPPRASSSRSRERTKTAHLMRVRGSIPPAGRRVRRFREGR